MYEISVPHSPASSLVDVFVIVDFAEKTSFILQSKMSKRDQKPCNIEIDYASSFEHR